MRAPKSAGAIAFAIFLTLGVSTIGEAATSTIQQTPPDPPTALTTTRDAELLARLEALRGHQSTSEMDSILSTHSAASLSAGRMVSGDPVILTRVGIHAPYRLRGITRLTHSSGVTHRDAAIAQSPPT